MTIGMNTALRRRLAGSVLGGLIVSTILSLLVVPALHGEHRLDVQRLREDFGQPQFLGDVERDLDSLARGIGVALEMQQ